MFKNRVLLLAKNNVRTKTAFEIHLIHLRCSNLSLQAICNTIKLGGVGDERNQQFDRVRVIKNKGSTKNSPNLVKIFYTFILS